MDTNNLKLWFLRKKRDLPWRVSPSPYAVWVSEVMLQQTQVAVVVPYFNRWMERFPTLEALATASLDEVIKMWEGLGYYSRARNLHEGARYLLEEHHGKFPHEEEALKKIKGLGPYTVGAIRSFAFHKKAVAVDGNVIRVLTRHQAIDADVSLSKTQRSLREIALSFLPDDEHWIVNEALIELGATVCMRTPKCIECPLKRSCKGYALGKTHLLPVNSKKTAYQPLYRAVAIILSQDHLLLQRGQKGAAMADLHEFPYFDTDEQGISNEKLASFVKESFGFKAIPVGILPEESHSFTRFRVRLRPVIFEVTVPKLLNLPSKKCLWAPLDGLFDLAFSSGHKRVLKHLLEV